MSGISTVVAYDGASTPVVHNLSAISVKSVGPNKVEGYWRESLGSIPVYAQVALRMSVERLKSGVYRTEMKLEVPVLEEATGATSSGFVAAPKVAYVNTITTTGLFHERSTTANRKATRGLALNIMLGESSSYAFGDTGPFPELFDKLISAT